MEGQTFHAMAKRLRFESGQTRIAEGFIGRLVGASDRVEQLLRKAEKFLFS